VPTSRRPRVSLLVTDLDNTLWDWFAIWHASFSTLLDVLINLSGIDGTVLEHEIRKIHQERGTSEYSHLLQEIPSLADAHPGADLAEIYGEAISASRSAREQAMVLYPGVLEALREIRSRGTQIIGYTESQAFYTTYRVKKLELDGVMDVLYSPPDHDFPKGVNASQLRTRPDSEYELQVTQHRSTPPGEVKPSARVLETIIRDASRQCTEVAYVGDSLMKDVAMAQTVGVADVHAKYGVVVGRDAYALLQRVSHWPESDVRNEEALRTKSAITPSIVLERGFYELPDVFDFTSP